MSCGYCYYSLLSCLIVNLFWAAFEIITLISNINIYTSDIFSMFIFHEYILMKIKLHLSQTVNKYLISEKHNLNITNQRSGPNQEYMMSNTREGQIFTYIAISHFYHKNFFVSPFFIIFIGYFLLGLSLYSTSCFQNFNHYFAPKFVWCPSLPLFY